MCSLLSRPWLRHDQLSAGFEADYQLGHTSPDELAFPFHHSKHAPSMRLPYPCRPACAQVDDGNEAILISSVEYCVGGVERHAGQWRRVMS